MHYTVIKDREREVNDFGKFDDGDKADAKDCEWSVKKS
jgi:hypothetical protein